MRFCSVWAVLASLICSIRGEFELLRARPEKIRSLNLTACLRQNGTHTVALEERNLDWCLYLHTDKTPEDQPDSERLIRFASAVEAEWQQADDSPPPSCSIGFRGYRGTYKLSPDFGAYPDCQKDYSSHRHALGTKKQNSKNRFQIQSPRCPISFLPLSRAAYRACQLATSDSWMILYFRSEILVEFDNHTVLTRTWEERRFFRTRIRTTPSEKDWLEEILHMEHKSAGCRAAILLRKDNLFNPSIEVQSFFSSGAADGTTETRLVANSSLTMESPWTVLSVALQPANTTAIQRFCINATVLLESGNFSLSGTLRCLSLDDSKCSVASRLAHGTIIIFLFLFTFFHHD